MAMSYWNPPNLNLSLEAVDAFWHHWTSTDQQPSDGSMANCWLAMSITKGLCDFFSQKKKQQNKPKFSVWEKPDSTVGGPSIIINL